MPERCWLLKSLAAHQGGPINRNWRRHQGQSPYSHLLKLNFTNSSLLTYAWSPTSSFWRIRSGYADEVLTECRKIKIVLRND
uniref:Uncharacterized protein n=1 Tax=Physcomitrium patens TaxID=3218 RepID=A0A2K1KA16_PHYPA|nr:hypothetical protein PHYPA_009806 [Physcomitrium patens]